MGPALSAKGAELLVQPSAAHGTICTQEPDVLDQVQLSAGSCIAPRVSSQLQHSQVIEAPVDSLA